MGSMPQIDVLKKAARELVLKFKDEVEKFSLMEFLKSGVDPFRFSFNVALIGIEKATEKEIEHKLAMKLENLIGEFHENYLGNCTHNSSESKWEKVPQGVMPGIDIKNTSLKTYLQIKSKHNSMNSSSSKRLAGELTQIKTQIPDANVGCGWIIASKKKACIGEGEIRKAGGMVLKGNELFSFITGDSGELAELMSIFPGIVADESKDINYEKLMRDASLKIYKELASTAKSNGMDVIKYLYVNAVGRD